jgi:symplekin
MDAASVVSEENSAVAEELAELQPDLVSLGPFVLPQPPPLSEEEAGEIGRSAVARVFGMLNASEASPAPAKGQSQQKLGFARLAGSTFDRDAWSVLLARLATRAPAGLANDPQAKGDSVVRRQTTIADSIRETLYRYILEDFRARINIAIIWLNEEWYNDRMQMKSAADQRGESEPDQESEPIVSLNYDTWVTRLLDGFLAYLDGRDIKVLVRFLSEVPEITIAITQRVASLAKDPERVNLCVQSLMYVTFPHAHRLVLTNFLPRYLIMFRPPAREMCLNTVEDVYQKCKNFLFWFPAGMVKLTCSQQSKNLDLLLQRSSLSGAHKVQCWRRLPTVQRNPLSRLHSRRLSLPLLQNNNRLAWHIRWKETI